MYYANENSLGNESTHENKYPFDLENKIREQRSGEQKSVKLKILY